MKKAIKIVVIIIFIILLFIIGLNIYNDLKIENKLKKEIHELNNIMEATSFDEKLFNEKISNTISTGNYYKVERASKNYLKDYYLSINNIIEYFKSNNLSDLITINNYKNDGKDFKKSIEKLNESKNKVKELKDAFELMKKEEKVLSYIDNNLNDYYINYYKNIIGKVKKTNTEKQLSNQINEYTTMIDNIFKVFDFLKTNKNNWEIGNGKILFKSDELAKEYTNLLNNVTLIAKDNNIE